MRGSCKEGGEEEERKKQELSCQDLTEETVI